MKNTAKEIFKPKEAITLRTAYDNLIDTNIEFFTYYSEKTKRNEIIGISKASFMSTQNTTFSNLIRTINMLSSKFEHLSDKLKVFKIESICINYILK